MYWATYVKGKKSEAATRKADTEGICNYLAKYFEHMFGSESLKHFTQEAIKEADGMGWDDNNHCPISIEDLESEEALGDKVEDVFEIDLDWSKINIDNDVCVEASEDQLI